VCVCVCVCACVCVCVCVASYGGRYRIGGRPNISIAYLIMSIVASQEKNDIPLVSISVQKTKFTHARI